MNKKNWIVMAVVSLVLAFVVAGLFLWGANLAQMIQAHLGG